MGLFQQTMMGLQLANTKFQYYLMGLLKNILVTICGLEIEHTFLVVAFEQDLNYELILGWLFIH